MSAVSIKFYLDSRSKGNATKLLPIFLYIRHNGRTLKVFTARKCTAGGWDVSRCRANPRKFPGSIELNGFLSNLEEQASNLYQYNARKAAPTTKEHLQKIVRELSGIQSEEQSLIDFGESFLEKSKFAENTKKSYRNTLNLIEEFAKNRKRRKPDFNDITLAFYDDFTRWLWDEREQNDNSVGKHIKNIKSLMAQSFERDLHNNIQFKKKKFHVFKTPSDSIYLNEAELKILEGADLSQHEHLVKVRDAFIIACWTGLRFSDLQRITPDKFGMEDGIEIFRIETEKTGEVVKIPVSPKVKSILEKYQFRLPVLTNQKMNEYLKDLCGLAKLEQLIELSDSKGGQKSRVTMPKFKLVTTHTARRSFASNL